MKLNVPLAWLSACLVHLSCNSNKGTSQLGDSTYFSKERVVLYRGTSRIKNKDTVAFLRNIAENLDLPILIGGYQGLYIRIWAWDFGEYRYVIDIKRNVSGNECSIIAFNSQKKDTSQYIYIGVKKSVVPKSGWNNFFDSLGKLNIPDMPSAKLSPQQKRRYTSMEYIQFELDQPNQYRFCEYLDPFYFRTEDQASAKVYEFMKYFNKEMDTHIYDVEKNRNDTTAKY